MNTPFNHSELNNDIEKYARKKSFEKNDIILNPGDHLLFIPIVISGCVRIIRQDAQDREIFLYHLFPGQTCALTLQCCQMGNASSIKAIAEEDTELLQIPIEMAGELLKHPEWKTFIDKTYSDRFLELLDVIDLIAFHNMDIQLLNYLQKRAQAAQTTTLRITHQEIADELHTHREAITRLLRTMEQKKLVRLGRNSIEILQ